ncbi:hypothetical protein COY62_01760 [bacterium (Candidatus Howlettbacteria) CG_4_10_14_0_8_um_filter_40_9]|nr:MAG: hypothetical protein COY62_01760 [bacterium (Candidatus Howlettbacteria) CG_4_10_14_0_8_um_filter_40_9]
MIVDLFTSIVQGIFTILLKTWWLLVPVIGIFSWQNFRKATWASKQEAVILSIKVPRSNEKDPTAAEMMFATLHGILRPKKSLVKEGSYQEHISFEIVATIDAIQFYVWVPSHLKDFVEGQVYAQYPSAELKIVEDYSLDIDMDDDGADDCVAGTEIDLIRNDILPIKTFQNFKVDPLAGITGVLSKLEKSDEQIWIQVLARPIPDAWKNRGLSYIHSKKNGGVNMDTQNIAKFVFAGFFRFIGELVRTVSSPAESDKKSGKELSPDETARISAIEEKITKLGYQVKIRALYLSKSKLLASQRLQAIVGTFKQYNSTNLNGFKSTKVYYGKNFLEDYRTRLFMDKGFILNIEELASLYHLPHTSVETPNIKWTSSKTGEPPTELPTELNTPSEELTPFAETNFRHNRTKFGIKTDDRRRHTYIIGKSGMGKSKLLENFIEEDIQRGNGLAVIDPNGDLIHDTLKKIPTHRINDVILLDPADQEFPVGFNPLEVDDPALKHFVAQGFVGTLEKLFGHSWGPRLEYILNYTILALLDYPNSTVLGIVRMLTDKNFRKKVVDEIKDPVVKKFWTTEFATYNDKFASEAVAPILNKVGQFTASSLIRNMIGQTKSTFNMREAMDNKKIILINLSTGRIGEVNSGLLGGMIITKLQLSAMSRADTNPEDRKDFFLYVDEFQHFATGAFATILSEARKYRLNLTIANQYIAQMADEVREAVFGNVGTMITFRVGAQDAGFLEKELNPPFEVGDIINLDRQQVYLKMTMNGQTSNPFSAKTLTIPEIDRGNTQTIINNSRERYGRPRREVEEKINKWSGMEDIVTEGSTSDVKETSPVQKTVNTKENNFSAPIVKNLAQKPQPVIKKEIPPAQTKPVSKPQINIQEKKTTPDKPTYNRPHVANNNEYKQKDAPKRERKEIDKETLKDIIRKAVKSDEPSENISEKQEIKNKKIDTTNKPQSDRGDNSKKEVSSKDLNISKYIERPKVQHKQNIQSHNRHHIDVSGRNSHKEIKVVTPDSFKDLKEIHPHQRIEVREHHNESSNNQIQPGETIVFKKDTSKTDKNGA